MVATQEDAHYVAKDQFTAFGLWTVSKELPGARQKFCLHERAERMQSDSEFGPRAFVLAQLFVGPVYVEDIQVWETIRADRDYLTRYFHQILSY
ncbi:MAG: hypothetical protein WA510_09255 [Acidobacteriaceae bacterium]